MSATHGALTCIAENRVAFVSRDDVAVAAAGIVLGEGHAGAIYNATGSRAYTGAERAAVISEVAGFKLGFVTMSADALRAGMTQAGLPYPVVNAVIGILRGRCLRYRYRGCGAIGGTAAYIPG